MKQVILDRIRAALADRPGPVAVPREYRRDLGGTDIVELFAERAADYRATVTRWRGSPSVRPSTAQTPCGCPRNELGR